MNNLDTLLFNRAEGKRSGQRDKHLVHLTKRRAEKMLANSNCLTDFKSFALPKPKRCRVKDAVKAVKAIDPKIMY